MRDAITSLGEAVLNALVNMAAQNLAQSLSSGIMGLFGGGQQDTSMTTGAAAVTASAGALSTAGASLLTGAAAIQAAAASLAAANGVQGLALLRVVRVRPERQRAAAVGCPPSPAYSVSPPVGTSRGQEQAPATVSRFWHPTTSS
ncbi:hypothetical protein HUK64_15315 [Pseudomonas aeruginosa]|uniref:hypothetical protein n=1 Tax=Pseudomonas aeruginosa TaxID=287 RepID=UPI0018E2AB27|nr:hypothetical protein [Pseudomonas aeruginosa]QQD35207.1 hypothetical protein HUF09_25245 [Pseudomonas aeruginosa]UJB86718.1 hypothetical protein HUK64_15315 [Pseudomonas aeruginosa]